MKSRHTISINAPATAVIDRRLLLRAGALGLLAGGCGWLGRARGDDGGPWQRLPAARELLDGAVPAVDALALDIPLVSEDGSAVPLTVSLQGTAHDRRVEVVHLFGAGNPNAEIAVFRLAEAVRPLSIATRVRLNRSQTVIALARTADGRWLAASRDVRVTVSGCLARADDAGTSDLMQARVRVPERVRRDASVEVLTLINHPMETGLREDAGGRPIPERLVRRFTLAHNGETVLDARLFAAVSANPYLRFNLTPEASGELRFEWQADGDGTTVETRTLEVA